MQFVTVMQVALMVSHNLLHPEFTVRMRNLAALRILKRKELVNR